MTRVRREPGSARIRSGEETLARVGVLHHDRAERALFGRFRMRVGFGWTLLADNAGNAVVDTDGDTVADALLSDFSILNPITAVTYDGWALEASLGRTEEKGDWRVDYQLQVVEQDAVFSAFAQRRLPPADEFFGPRLRHQLPACGQCRPAPLGAGVGPRHHPGLAHHRQRPG